MAPLVKELEARPGLESICCVTAQHREMLDSVLEIFGVVPQFDLDIMEPGQSLSTITSKCLLGMEGVLAQARPDLILVHGDTSVSYTHLDVYKRQVLDELADCLESETDVESAYEVRELGQCIQRFVKALPERDGNIAMRRYFFAEPVAVIAKRYGLTENNVMVILSRTRKKLKDHLIKEGYFDESDRPL